MGDSSEAIGAPFGIAPSASSGATASLLVARLIPSGFELRDQPRLLQLGEHASDLTHGDLERVVRLGEVIAGAGKHPNTALDQRDNAGLLDDELVPERYVPVLCTGQRLNACK